MKINWRTEEVDPGPENRSRCGHLCRPAQKRDRSYQRRSRSRSDRAQLLQHGRAAQQEILGWHQSLDIERHGKRRSNAGERINHEADQGAIAQAGVRVHVDGVEHAPRFLRRQHRRLAALDDVARPTQGRGRIRRYNLADHKSVEQMADCGRPLLGGRRRSLARVSSSSVTRLLKIDR